MRVKVMSLVGGNEEVCTKTLIYASEGFDISLIVAVGLWVLVPYP